MAGGFLGNMKGKLGKEENTKIRNAFAKNMLSDIKISKAHLSKTIQSGGRWISW